MRSPYVDLQTFQHGNVYSDGIGVLCPEKRGTISRLVFRSMIAGVFVSLMSALIVSMVTLF